MHQICALAKILLFILIFTFIKAEANAVTFEQRVSIEKALNQVYWEHTIWPVENSHPKPSLNKVLTHPEMVFNTEEYLRKSVALESYWHRPITPELIQKEIDRMARETQDPDLLQELWSALGNDPYLIAECLARPLLVDRLTAKLDGFDKWWTAQRQHLPLDVKECEHIYHLPKIAGGMNSTAKESVAASDSWKTLTVNGAPAGRDSHTAIWTGTQMIIWGGDDSNNALRTGGRYTPATNSWAPITTTGAPAARTFHSAIWTGTQMIVWGGNEFRGSDLNTGGRYNPLTNKWTPVTTSKAPAPRSFHTAIWTGTEMIVWGGVNIDQGSQFKTGGRYNPSTNSWTAISTNGAPSARSMHTAIWTGTQMIIWGGRSSSKDVKTGGRYTPSTNSWTGTSTTGAPSPRSIHTAVWTGTRMIVWGGFAGNNAADLNTGAQYNPSTNSWKPMTIRGAPSPRDMHTAIWTGSQMIVWGGFDFNFLSGSFHLNTGGRYNPSTNFWLPTSISGAPSGREIHTAVWTGKQMIVWGGVDGTTDINTGGRYVP